MNITFLRAGARIARSAGFGLRAFSIRTLAGAGPRVVFMPAYGREGAALHRIYNIAEQLCASGEDVHVLPWKFTLAQRRYWLSVLRPDIVVMQGTRHPLNRPALYAGHRVVLDLDDADFHLPHLAASVRAAMGHVTAVMAGSGYIADWCRKAGACETHVVWTGSPVSRAPRVSQSQRPPVVAWAQTRPMQYRHEAALIRRVMRQVALRHPGTVLRLYDRRPGDDPAFADSFRAPGLELEWHASAGYETFLSSLDDVALGLAPLLPTDPFCRAKSFGKLLAYFDRQVPVVASDFGEPRVFFTPETGVLCRSQAQWGQAISTLLPDAPRRQRMAEAGFAAFTKHLTTQVAADQVKTVLHSLGTASSKRSVPALVSGHGRHSGL